MQNNIREFLLKYGNKFRRLRLKAGLTQLEAANEILCSQAIISHIENGYMLPPPRIEKALYDLYTDKL